MGTGTPRSYNSATEKYKQNTECIHEPRAKISLNEFSTNFGVSKFTSVHGIIDGSDKHKDVNMESHFGVPSGIQIFQTKKYFQIFSAWLDHKSYKCCCIFQKNECFNINITGKIKKQYIPKCLLNICFMDIHNYII